MTFAGEAQFGLLAEVLLGVAGSAEEAHLRAVQLWCAIHGMVVLRQPMSQFPWPDLDEQLISLARVWTTPSDALSVD